MSRLYPNGFNRPYTIDPSRPIPTDGDTVYPKDIWIEESDITGWTGSVVSPFENLHSSLTNDSTDNPKTLTIHFKRSVYSNAVGFGSTGGGNFSNLKIEFIGSGNVVRYTFDDSANDTKMTSYLAETPPLAYNAIKLYFYTADQIDITNITIRKAITADVRIKATKPDDTITDIEATAGGNLKMSIEEFDTAVSTDTNKMNTAPYLVDEFGVQAQMASDNMFAGSPIVIDSAHHEIHCGDHYVMTWTKDMPNGGNAEVLIIVPDELVKRFHFKWTVDCEAEALVDFFEGTTYSAAGTTLNSYNRERDSSLTDFLGITHTPTVTAAGTNLHTKTIGSGIKAGGTVGREEEFVLANNTVYLLRVTNNVGVANYANIEFNYYVHPGI